MHNENVEKASHYLNEQMSYSPEIGVILGSGLGDFTDHLSEQKRIPYKQIPGFPLSTVAGHAGNFVFGNIAGKSIAAMQGRFHLYEGYSIEKVILPILVMHELGVKTLIVTNAAGGINETFRPGDLMIIKDHMNHMGVRAARKGMQGTETAPFFYNKQLQKLAKTTARQLNISVTTGVYIANSGPNYETPAEIQMLKKLGGDAVGMSTVPEVVTAVQCGMEVLGISCISNMAAGLSTVQLSHEEVVATANEAKPFFLKLVTAVIENL